MDYVLFMQITEADDDLPEKEFGNGFIKLLPSFHILEQISTLAQLHEVEVIFVGFEVFKKLDDVLMPDSLENFDFFLYLNPSLRVVNFRNSVNTLDGNQFPDQLVNSQVDFAIGASTDNSSNAVEEVLGFWWFVQSLEADSHLLLDEPDVVSVGLRLLSLFHDIIVFGELLQLICNISNLIEKLLSIVFEGFFILHIRCNHR